MSQLTIYLENTTEAKFCKWLSVYSSNMNSANAEYPYHGGGVYKVDYPYNVIQVSKMTFSARIKQPSPSEGKPPPGVDEWKIDDPEMGLKYIWWEWVRENAIKMSWIEVGERLKVIINHEGAKWIIPPVFQLLWNIKADYPETGDTILPYIKEKADWWNLNPPFTLETNFAMAYIIAEQARDEINKKAKQLTEQQPQSVSMTKPDRRQRGKSGRPHLPDDVWAWEQVNIDNRERKEVYEEWHERNGVKARNLQDPERQFDRITQPEWMNKSGQNI